MQILKESIKNKILKAASLEFNEKGFQAASMRKIAANAGITPREHLPLFQHQRKAAGGGSYSNHERSEPGFAGMYRRKAEVFHKSRRNSSEK